MNHEIFMKRAIQLAKKGLGHTYPNPVVGSVIVYKGKIIGEGYHTQAGKPHAEINAINSVKDKSLLKKSTLYVTLEPCSHYGKTPPCAVKIAQLKIPRVVIGTIDTTEKVNGKGIKIMQQAGIQVITGVLEKEARELNKRFFTFHEKKRPYIILKWAQTADGFIDKKRNTSKPQINKITENFEHILVHKWRSEEQSIFVGTNTVRNDNPQLTVRKFYGKNPIRIFIDKKCEFVKNYKITDNSAKSICFTYSNATNLATTNLEIVKIDEKKDFLEQILFDLYKKNIQSVLVEGGSFLINSLIDNELWDEARFFVAKKLFIDGLKAPRINDKFLIEKILTLENSYLFYAKRK